MPMVGGSKPDLRLSLRGKLTTGNPRIGTSLKRITAPRATPTSLSMSNSKLLARSVQEGDQLASSSRSHVV